jgi:hypothetical protein
MDEVDAAYNQAIYDSKYMGHELTKKQKMEFVRRVLKNNVNLDLKLYKPYLH